MFTPGTGLYTLGGLGMESSLGLCGCWCRDCCPTGTHTLRLARAQPADSGTYLCEALNAAGQDQKTVQLNVLGMSYRPIPAMPPLPSPSAPWKAPVFL